ncbi:MAG: hypothetical protein ACYTG7_03545 [Planctomycetota bacterium]
MILPVLWLASPSSLAEEPVVIAESKLFDYDVLLQTIGTMPEEKESAAPAKEKESTPHTGKGKSSAYPDEWQFELTPYAHLPFVNYDSTVAGQTVDVDLSFGDLLDDFDVFALSAHFEGWKGNWGFIIDSAYASLEGDFDFGPFIDVDVDIVDFPIDLALGYRLDPIPLTEGQQYPNLVISGKAGARYHYLRQEIRLSLPPPLPTVKPGKSEDWVAPVVGGRIRLHTSEKLWFNLYGDFAGFGIGSTPDITINFLLGLGYKFTDTFSIRGGYYYSYIDYSRGSGIKEFGLKGYQQGPVIGATWSF